MVDKKKTDIKSLEDHIDLGIDEISSNDESMVEVDARVNIDSLKDPGITAQYTDLDAMEYESKLSKLDKLQKMTYMDQKTSFDLRTFTPLPIVLIVGLLVFTWYIYPNYIQRSYLLSPVRLETWGPVGKTLLLKSIALARLLGPILAFFFYKKYPLMQNTKYEIKIDYQFIEGPKEVNYSPMIERNRVKWDDITNIDYNNKFNVNHIQCFNKNSRPLIAIRLDIKNFDKLKKLIVEYTDKDHPLHKVFS
jgi:hypothetical protein